MKLRLDRSEFADAVSWATRTVNVSRATLPALSGVLLAAEDGTLTCRTTDLEVAAEVRVPAAIDEPGRVLLPGRLLAQIVAKLPAAPVELSLAGESVELRCGRATYRVRTMVADDFPSLPEPDDDAPSGAVRADAFARLVTQVARAAATDEARPVLTGVQLDVADGRLTAAATDSYRLAVRRLDWDVDVEASALVPARALSEAARAAGEAGEEVTIVLEDAQATFLLGDRRLTTRLIEGSFPNYAGLLPAAHESTITVARAELVEALQRVAVVTLGTANTPVSLTFEDGSVDLQAGAQGVGDAAEALPATIEGDELSISFNPSYLLAGLEATGASEVRFELNGARKAAVLRPVADPDAQEGDATDDLLYLLMPMRV